MKLATTLAVFAAGSMTLAAQADLLAYWDFGNDDLNVTVGSGTLTHNFEPANVVFFTGTGINALDPDNHPNRALALQNGPDGINNGRWVQFALDTTNAEGLVMTFASQRTSTGFDSNQIAYSTDGGLSFTDFGSPYTPESSFFATGVLEFDFSSITALDNNDDVVIRITFDGGSESSSAGNNRLANVQFNVLPAPGALALLGAAGLVGIRRRRA